MKNQSVYFDNAATTPVDREVIKAMTPYFDRKYGNASEYHSLGMGAKRALEAARGTIADFLGASPQEIVFAASATESINLSHKGLVEALRLTPFAQGKLPHIITSQIEHKAVLATCGHLEELGWADVTYLPVDRFGLVDINSLKKAMRTETVLVSLMLVNNEVGTIEPVVRIGDLLKAVNKKRERKVYFHTDATQAIQYLNCNVNHLGVDLLSFTGHKIYAPKGIGGLFVRKGTPLIRQLDGGGQESGLRASTENVPYIVGLAKAVSLIDRVSKPEPLRVLGLRDELIGGILKIPGVKLTGHSQKRAPHIASFIVKGVEGEAMVMMLSNIGVYASSGSACTSSNLSPSHVLSAMGVSPEASHGSIRFSLGKNTGVKDIGYVLKEFPLIVARLRKMSPVI